MLKEKIKLQIEKFEILEDILDSDFALGEIYVCSEGRNLHNIDISLNAIINAQETLKNKYLVAQINKDGTDFEGHETTESIIRTHTRVYKDGYC